ncbi:MAG: AraC family transcriptional regulator [Proteobacteria bacterium]|jgi:AraC family transcriptional regulator|nr:AraC family transcriptional regulator [Pseudomonadota bacterium]
MASDWDKRKAVQRMQDHIEAHLTQPITLQSLARAARYSPYYAARIFKQYTGTAPFEYIRRRRLSAAAHELIHTRARITDVAFDFVFDTHEGFTRAFARQFGMTPSHYRQARPPIALFMPEQMRDHYRHQQQGVAIQMSPEENPHVVFVQILERPKRKLILKRGQKAGHYFDYCDEVGCHVWETLSAVENALHEPMGLWLPPGLRPEGTSIYVQGVEVAKDHDQPPPEGFDIIDLPPCKMLVFQGQPFDDEDFEQAITSLWDVIRTYNPATIGYAWADEDAPRFQLEPHGYRGYIEGRPVRSEGQGPFKPA